MSKYFCIQIHTERLHDDVLWKEIENTLEYFAEKNIQATWFSVNPTFAGYRAMDFDEDKWKERLKIIADYGQDIQQHTHFYKGKEGVPKGECYDLSQEHIEKRLLEDKRWMEEQGYYVKGFVSGAWYVNDDLYNALSKLGYAYDSSVQSQEIKRKNGILEIPVSSKVRRLLKSFLLFNFRRHFIKNKEHKIITIAFHDYDLENFRFRFALKLIVWIFKWMKFDFINTKTLYKELSFKKA